MAPADRIRQAFDLSESVRRAALARLRAIYPDYTDLELVEVLVGRELGGAQWQAAQPAGGDA